nr:hypothetical protein [Tanacetum cinerariifolium]
DPARTVPIPETFHEQIDDELTEAKIKQMETGDQAIQTILFGLPEDIYVAVDSCETAQEIWLRVQQMMKGSDIGIQEKKANRPPMLNKENYVPWSSRLLRYAKSRPNGKLIHNSIINGPYVRRMIPEPGDTNWDVPEKKAKLFNEWERFTSNKEESIESYYHRFLKLMNDLKRNKHFPEKIASNLKFLNNLQPEWSRHKEVDELKAERLAKIQDPLALMANSNNTYVFPAPHQDQPSFNQIYIQQPILNPDDITDPTTAMNMALALMAKAFKLNYSTPTNNNQRISSNPRNRNQVAQNLRVQNVVQGNGNQNLNGNGNLVAARAEGNAAGHNGNQIRCYNCRGVGHFARDCTVRPRRRDAAYLQTQLLIAQKEDAGIQFQAEEYDLMAAVVDLDEIKEVNANCILMANLQQASTSGTQSDKAPVYDSDGSAEVHDYENCDDNEIFNMLIQEEQYIELLEPIPEQHQVSQNDNNVIFEVTSVKQSEEIVEQHHENFEETRVLYDSLYQNLAIEVEKVNLVNCKLKETNADLTTELARFKNKEFFFEISQEKCDKLKMLSTEAAKFVGDFKSLAKEADESLVMHKALELEIERLLRAVVSQDIISVVQKESVVDTSDL